MFYIFIAGLILTDYVIGLVGVVHTREGGGKVAGILYGIPVMLLSLSILLPSIEFGTEWLWLLIVGAPLVLSWLTFWNGFRKSYPRSSGFIGIVTAELMLGVALILYFWPEPIRWFFLLIFYCFPSLGYPMA